MSITTDAPIADFAAWVARWEAAPEAHRTDMVHEGVQRAGARRNPFKALIRADPQSAIAAAIPYATRIRLPREVQALLEEPVSVEARFEYAVACAMDDAQQGGEERFVSAGARRWNVATYGRRLDIATKQHLSVIGVAVDEWLALDEHPVRRMDEAERIARGLSPGPLWVESLGEIRAFPDTNALERWTASLLEAEAALDPNARAGETPDDSIGALSTYTEGDKRVLLITCDFTNLTGFPVTSATLSNAMNTLTSYFFEASFGKTRLSVTQVPDLVRLPQPGQSYTNNFSLLLSHARTGASALGYDTSAYDFYIVLTDEVGSGTNKFDFSYAGKAWVGSPGCHLVEPYYTLRTAGHELGHNFGLRHANYWRTDADTPIGRDTLAGGYVADTSNAEWIEYGHRFSVMSAQSSSDMNDRTAHFAPREKRHLDWITAAQVAVVTNSGILRLYRFDHRNATQGPFAIHVKKASGDYTTNAREYWLGYRMAYTDNAWLRHGLQIDWSRASYGSDGAIQLDMTPFSNDDPTGTSWTDDNTDKWDGALLIGRTYSDHAAGLHITPTARGGAAPEEWMDVVVNIGAFPSNRAPALDLDAGTNAVGVNADIVFTANATDDDGDALAYEWDFGLPKNIYTQSLNQARVTNRWSAAGEYVVRCVASDMKGGRSSASLIVRVGSPSGVYRIEGLVLSNGVPVEGVRIHTSHTNWTLTASDGRYALVNMKASTNTVRAHKEAQALTPAFDNPVVLPSSAQGINFGINAQPALLLTPDRAEMSEGASHDYVLHLGARPASAVTITLALDTNAWRVEPAQFTLQPNDWVTGRALRVTALDDTLPGPAARTGLLVHAASSSDAGYNQASISFIATALEDDTFAAPALSWIHPATDTSTVEQTALTLEWATMNPGSITQLTLMVDGLFAHALSPSDHSFEWPADEIGPHVISLHAVDVLGGMVTSPPLQVLVLADRDGDRIPDADDHDNDNDGLPDEFEAQHFLDPLAAEAGEDADGDRFSNFCEYVAGTDPTNAASFFQSQLVWTETGPAISVQSITGRLYTLLHNTDLTTPEWNATEEGMDLPGTGAALLLPAANISGASSFRVHIRMAD